MAKLEKLALNTLAIAYKSQAREMDKRREGKPGEGRAALRRSIRDNGCAANNERPLSAVHTRTAAEI
ncbi:hypothetical protein Scep_001719 [Stephania cephalantha]|uniref:Uncharacterized protein n=1 Tax=Stephania cephalantha TaxID=152367 RepID=A0AAP0L8L7_9MAGN